MSATVRGWQTSLLLHALLISSFALLNIGLAATPPPLTIELSFITGAPAAAPATASPPAKPQRQARPVKPKPVVQKQQEQSAPLPVKSEELPAETVIAEKESAMETEVAENVDTASAAAKSGPAGDPQVYVREHFAYIRNLVMRSLGYPALAQRMGWSGRVVITFTILEDGTVSDMRVEESSGKKLLDENALATVLRVAPFPPPPVPAQIVMPINYRLN